MSEERWTIPVLNNGFVSLVESMGNDLSVVQAARVSYGQGTKGEEQDKRLIHFLMKHDHGTPFEMIDFKFHVRCPIFVARQWFRHRICSYNEISLRYTELKEGFWLPALFRKPSKTNKQGSDDPFSEDDGALFTGMMMEAYDKCEEVYNNLLEAGVAREIARAVLPLSSYTEFYWKINARSLMNFLRLRMDEAAQTEIRVYAYAINEMFKSVAPWTAEAFEEYVVGK